MDDLYVIFRKKLATGVLAIHPHRWLQREAHDPLSIGLMDYSFAKRAGLRWDVPMPCGPPLCIDGIEIADVRRDARAALKKCGRQSRAGVYLADSLVSRCYAGDLPRGVEVQNALKDRLKEKFPSLKFEVSTPVGQVDCVTDDAIYEVAKMNSWKHALGQLCAYSFISQGAEPFCTSTPRRKIPERSRKSRKLAINMASSLNISTAAFPVLGGSSAQAFVSIDDVPLSLFVDLFRHRDLSIDVPWCDAGHLASQTFRQAANSEGRMR